MVDSCARSEKIGDYTLRKFQPNARSRLSQNGATLGLLRRFDPTAYLPDFEDLPGLLDQWHEAASGWFDNSIDREKTAIADQDDGKPGIVQFYNPARYDPGGPLVEQTIPWNAFPK